MQMKKTRITLILCSFLATACSSNGAKQATAPALPQNDYVTFIKPGESFKHSQFTDIENYIVQLKNKKKLIILFATWCADSQRTIEQLQASPWVNNSELQIIAIGREENSTSLAQFKRDYHLNYPLISDENRTIYNAYANKGIPRLLLLDEDNRLIQEENSEDVYALERLLNLL